MSVQRNMNSNTLKIPAFNNSVIVSLSEDFQRRNENMET